MAECIEEEVSDETFDEDLESPETPSPKDQTESNIVHEFDICQLQYHLLLQQLTHRPDPTPNEGGSIGDIYELENTIESLTRDNKALNRRIASLKRELDGLEPLRPQPAMPEAYPGSFQQFTPRFSCHSRALSRLSNLYLAEGNLKRLAFDISMEQLDTLEWMDKEL